MSLKRGSFKAKDLAGPEPRALNLVSLFEEDKLQPAYCDPKHAITGSFVLTWTVKGHSSS